MFDIFIAKEMIEFFRLMFYKTRKRQIKTHNPQNSDIVIIHKIL